MVDCGWIVVFEILDSGRSSESGCTKTCDQLPLLDVHSGTGSIWDKPSNSKTMANGSDASHVYNSEWARVVKPQFNNSHGGRLGRFVFCLNSTYTKTWRP